MRWILLGVCAFAAGCSFHVDGVAGSKDLGGPNAIVDFGPGAAPVDLTTAPPTDGGVAAPIDLAEPPGPPDLAPPFTPSHVAASDFQLGTTALTVVSSINTDGNTLSIDGAQPAAGIHFAVENGLAVLAVSSLTIPSGKTVRVTGGLPLVVVSSGAIVISGVLDASAHGAMPGPNGGAPGATVLDGKSSGSADSGGAGAGFGSSGGKSGAVSGCTGPPAASVAGGAVTGSPQLVMLTGGSGGGNGSPGACNVTQYPNARGGAGGGAVQLTAAASITVEGSINVGGGGGQGGCKDPNHIDSGSGGGGGAGGALLLEAPSVTISGTLAANGGGGGGGAVYTVGGPGGDGTAGVTAATAGAGGKDAQSGGSEVTNDRGGVGSTSANGGDSLDDTSCYNSGGGGGGAGRIYLRSRGSASTGGATILPNATPDPTL